MDASKLKAAEGDLVTVRGRVEYQCDDPALYGVVFREGSYAAIVHVADILSIEPRPIAVGDRVHCHSTAWLAEVWAFSPDGQSAWIGEIGGSRHLPVPLSTLTRADASDE